MNDSTVKEIRKLEGWKWTIPMATSSVTAGEPDTILNRPVKTSSYVPLAVAGANL